MTHIQKGTYIVLMFFMSLLVAGCLETSEGWSISLDLDKNICSMIFYGFGSDQKEEAKIEEDFQDLIKLYNGYHSDKSGNILKVELYPESDKLNGKITFRLTESFPTENPLRELQPGVDETGYFYSWNESEQVIVKGNGIIVKDGAMKKMKWPKTAKLIQYEMRKSAGFKDENKITNLLTRWQNWINQNQKGRSNAVKPAKETIK